MGDWYPHPDSLAYLSGGDSTGPVGRKRVGPRVISRGRLECHDRQPLEGEGAVPTLGGLPKEGPPEGRLVPRRRCEGSRGVLGRMARELDWTAPWSKVLEWNPPFAKWFLDGKLNVSANCLDRHLAGPRRNKAALVWEGEPGERRVLTYHDMWREVSRFANVLKGLGVERGDRVTIYMPMIPELPIAMLACARVGAVHSVIFGGFSARAIRDRAGDAETRVIVT